MLADTRIIQRIGSHEIQAQRHEVMFHDGTAVWLHQVRRAGIPHLTLRALATDSGCLLLFDLTALDRQLDADLRVAPDRDRPGYVLHTMRLKYATKAAFVADARRHSLAVAEPDLQVAA